MRLAGFNANRVGIEPMNGQGIYAASATQAMPWDITATMAAPATVSAAWDIRYLVGLALGAGWNVWQFAVQSAPLLWNVRQAAAQSVAAVWDVGSGVAANVSVSWRVPFSKRMGAALDAHSPTSALVRHVATSPLTER